MNVTEWQKLQIRKLTRRAQRRMERATKGQRRYLELQVEKATGSKKFSAATKGLTFEQAAAKLKILDRFLRAATSTRKGWDAIKAENVRKANLTLSNPRRKDGGYHLTDEELAEILEQIDDASYSAKYTAINLVEAAKMKAGDDWDPSSDAIADIISEKITEHESFSRALRARKEKEVLEKRNASREAKKKAGAIEKYRTKAAAKRKKGLK